jgi:hypothetical protein
VHGRHLVGEEPFGGGEFVLGVDEAPLGGSNEPSAADTFAPSQLRLVPIRPTAPFAFSA